MPEDFLPKPFRCDETSHDGTLYLRPVGDLDMSTVPRLDDRIRAAVNEGSRRVVVDLSGLSFMDSTGITLVSRWSNEARRDGFNFALIEGAGQVQRLFELTGIAAYFTFVSG